MSNALYDKARQAFLNGDIDWTNDDIRLIFVDAADYIVDLVADDFLDDIPAAARVATSGSLTGKTTTAGVAGAANVDMSGVTGDTFEAIVLYQHTGTESTSHLIAYMDSGYGLAFAPTGGAVTVIWDTGPNKIFKL